jgi:hypothetical protein
MIKAISPKTAKAAKETPLSGAERARLAELEAIHVNTARHIFDCGTRHLRAERLVRIVERYGWPKHHAMIEQLTAEVDEAGPQFAAKSISDVDDIPF